MNAKQFSITGNKGIVIVVLGGMVLGLLFGVAVSHSRISAAGGIAVDWSNFSPRCLATDQNCKPGTVAVDWTSGFTHPCQSDDPNCKSGPVAVDWTSGFTPACKSTDSDCKSEPVAIDWSNIAPNG